MLLILSQLIILQSRIVGEIGAVVDSHPYGWGTIPGKSCSVQFAVSLCKGLSLYFMCSDQHVKY